MRPTHLFRQRKHSFTKMYNSAWNRFRSSLGLKHVRVHSLKHTFERTPRAASVSLDTHMVLPDHRNGDITPHYSAPKLADLVEAANSVCSDESGKTPALVILRQKAAIGNSISVCTGMANWRAGKD